jgi:hypothetical protein
MKKLVIFLIPLIVSIPTFAQDESLLLEINDNLKFTIAPEKEHYNFDQLREK